MRSRKKQTFLQRGCAGLGFPHLCMTGPETPHQFCEIMGPVRPFRLEQAAHYIDSMVMGASLDDRAELIGYMVRTGHCVLHTIFEVALRRIARMPASVERSRLLAIARCHCAACDHPADTRHEWHRDSARLAVAELAAEAP